jgi:hypothetical protein
VGIKLELLMDKFESEKVGISEGIKVIHYPKAIDCFRKTYGSTAQYCFFEEGSIVRKPEIAFAKIARSINHYVNQSGFSTRTTISFQEAGDGFMTGRCYVVIPVTELANKGY